MLTDDARRLLAWHVESIGTLDLLLLMRAQDTRRWTVDDVCGALNCPAGWAEAQLLYLEQAGVIASGDDGFAYAPESERVRAAVDDLVRAVARDRAAVSRWVFAAPRRR